MTDRAALCERVVDAVGEAVLLLDREGVVRLWNPGAEELFGYPAEETVGETITFLAPERYRDAHWTGWERAMAAGETKYGRREVLKTPVRRADGSELVVDLTVSFVAEDGEPRGMVAVARATDRTDDPAADEPQRVGGDGDGDEDGSASPTGERF